VTSNRKALVVVDVQAGLDDVQYGPRNNREAESHIAQLLGAWRGVQWPVIFAHYNSPRMDSPLRAGAPGNRIKQQVAPLPCEFIAEKSVNSVFKAPGFVSHLEKADIRSLVFVGIATDGCISASAREAKDLGYSVLIVADACATFDRRGVDGRSLAARLVHEIELGILCSAGIRVLTTTETLGLLRNGQP
jgi:nicotinamidase-related amidase